MARATWLVLSHIVIVLLPLALNHILQNHCVDGAMEPQVPCLFIFGDSLSDSGNNNNLPTSAKSNYKPYGVDFPTGQPTGRFTNGLTSIDFISKFLGFTELIPPFANIAGKDVLKGVNYASGAAGILVETGKHMGANIDLILQLENHKIVVSKIATRLGGYEKAKEYLGKCLYYVNIGSNDYLNNYFLPEIYQTSRIYNPQQFAKVLIDHLSLVLEELYIFGARKYVSVGVGSIGCIPLSISRRGTNNNGTCVEDENAAAIIFNGMLRALVDSYNQKFSADSKFIFVNSTSGTIDPSLGFKVTNASCCPSGENGQCIAGGTPCSNRNEYVFYDDIHTSQAVNQIVASQTYNSTANPNFTYPTDIMHLVQS